MLNANKMHSVFIKSEQATVQYYPQNVAGTATVLIIKGERLIIRRWPKRRAFDLYKKLHALSLPIG